MGLKLLPLLLVLLACDPVGQADCRHDYDCTSADTSHPPCGAPLPAEDGGWTQLRPVCGALGCDVVCHVPNGYDGGEP